MKIKFVKMQGAGNDYIVIDCRKKPLKKPNTVAKKLSERRFSVGGDGIVLIEPSDSCDCSMRMFNTDGSEGDVCGTALRCVGRYLLGRSGELSVSTPCGVRSVRALGKLVSVEMGVASFRGENLPKVGLFLLPFDGKELLFTAVSVGNPHAVCFVDCLNFDVSAVARELQESGVYPFGVNVEFAVLEKDGAKVRVVERGNGETLSCGTGACAVAAAICRHGLLDFGSVKICYAGGELFVDVDKDFNLTLRGEAEEVFRGSVAYE